MRRVTVGLFFLALALSSAPGIAQRAPVTTAASGSFIRIVSVSPPLDQSLKPDEEVQFEVEVEYTLAVESGFVSLYVQRGDYAGPPLGQTSVAVTRGSGKVKLSTVARVSGRSSLMLFTPINHNADGGSSLADARTYRVLAE